MAINTSELAPGTYFYLLRTSGGEGMASKFIKE
jgi:hypothetical protein